MLVHQHIIGMRVSFMRRMVRGFPGVREKVIILTIADIGKQMSMGQNIGSLRQFAGPADGFNVLGSEPFGAEMPGIDQDQNKENAPERVLSALPLETA